MKVVSLYFSIAANVPPPAIESDLLFAIRDGIGPFAKSIDLEHADRSVPDNRFS